MPVTSVIERREYLLVHRDAHGERRVSLIKCPACDIPLNPHLADNDEVEYVPYASEHLQMHTPEDFGLTPLQPVTYEDAVATDGGQKR